MSWKHALHAERHGERCAGWVFPTSEQAAKIWLVRYFPRLVGKTLLGVAGGHRKQRAYKNHNHMPVNIETKHSGPCFLTLPLL